MADKYLSIDRSNIPCRKKKIEKDETKVASSVYACDWIQLQIKRVETAFWTYFSYIRENRQTMRISSSPTCIIMIALIRMPELNWMRLCILQCTVCNALCIQSINQRPIIHSLLLFASNRGKIERKRRTLTVKQSPYNVKFTCDLNVSAHTHALTHAHAHAHSHPLALNRSLIYQCEINWEIESSSHIIPSNLCVFSCN